MAEKTTTKATEAKGKATDAEGTEATQAKAAEDEKTEGLESTGNPLDLSTPYVDPAGSSVSANVTHQEGAPASMVEAVEESERLGYIAPEQNALKPTKPDYTQRNPKVMNQGAEG